MTLAITTPTEGATVPPIHDVTGTGAAPDAEVELWSGDRDPLLDTPNATTTADASGNWGFTGDTPATLGPVTWTVTCDENEGMASVSITVSDEEPVPPEPEPEEPPVDYMPPDPPDVYVQEPVPSVADGQPPDPRMATTNAYENGGLPLDPREPYPTGNPPPARTYSQINSGRP